MSDLSSLLMPRTYPEAFGLIYNSFAPQPDLQTCGAAALRHGLLLGGLMAPVGLLGSLLEIRKNNKTDYRTLLEALRRLGFEVEKQCRSKRKGQSTAAFLNDLREELDKGAFLLPCRNGGNHWVCMGAWDGQRAGVIDSCYGHDGSLNIAGYTEQEFDATDWQGYINVVRPGRWRQEYQYWLPARRALLRMPVNADLTSMEAAVAVAAQQYLNDAEYSYHKSGLRLYLRGGVKVPVQVKDPGKDAFVVGEEVVGEDRILVFRRASGMLTGQTPAARVRRRRRRRSSPVQGTLTGQTPPELVVRAGLLRAAWLG
jgi:hypothetical protein